MGRVARIRSTPSAHLQCGRESVWQGLRPHHGACHSRHSRHHFKWLSSLMRQCRSPSRCAMLGEGRHTRTRRPARHLKPCRLRCGPPASLPCTDTHSLPLFRWPTPLRSRASHSTPSHFTARKYLLFPPIALPHGCIFRKIENRRQSLLHRAVEGTIGAKMEKIPLHPFLKADLSACYGSQPLENHGFL